jgi:hypothetical protein
LVAWNGAGKAKTIMEARLVEISVSQYKMEGIGQQPLSLITIGGNT